MCVISLPLQKLSHVTDLCEQTPHTYIHTLPPSHTHTHTHTISNAHDLMRITPQNTHTHTHTNTHTHTHTLLQMERESQRHRERCTHRDTHVQLYFYLTHYLQWDRLLWFVQ